jgi:SNF2 family DNA or RNA helicase
MRNLDGAENDVIMRTASLYISWVNCVKVSDKGIPRKQIQRAISEIDGFSEYAEELDTRLSQYCNQMDKAESRRRKASKPGTSKRAARRYNEDKQQDSSLTPHKKRKREVKERQEVKQNHANAQLRAAIQERQRKRLEQSMESVGVSNDDPSRQAVTFEAPIIYLDPHIGRRVKPHQLRGVQFMWRELIQDEKRQGCLLAHTMGLGKTMQV